MSVDPVWLLLLLGGALTAGLAAAAAWLRPAMLDYRGRDRLPRP